MKKCWMTRGFLALTLLIGLAGVFTANAAPADFSVKKAVTPPTLNGRIEEGEWGEALYTLTPKDTDHASLSFEQGQEDAEVPDAVRVYMLWDDTYLYLGVEVDSEHHYNQQDTDVNGWNGHAVLFTLETENGRDRLSAALGYQNMSLFGIHHRGNKGDVESGSYLHTGKVAREGTTTTYEVQIQWKELDYLPADQPAAGVRFQASVTAYLAHVTTMEYAGSWTYMNKDAENSWVRPFFTMAAEEGNAGYETSATEAPTAPSAVPTTADAPATTTPHNAANDHESSPLSIGWIAAIAGSVIIVLVVAVLVLTLRKKP